jgi:hypothetical protein
VTGIDPVIYDIAPGVTRAIHNRYKAYVEREDVLQECLSWALTRHSWIAEQLLEATDPDKRKHAESRIAWQMRRAAYYQGYTLGQLLPYVIASVVDNTVLEQIQDMIQDGLPRGSSSPSEGGNLLANLIDIKIGYTKLEAEDKILLRVRYLDSFTLQQIANHYQCSVSTADRRIDGAMRRLQDLLGGVSPFQ